MTVSVSPAEGMGVLHLFYRVDREAAAGLPAAAAKDLSTALARLLDDDDVQAHVFVVLGHKADLMIMALAEDVLDLRRVQSDVELTDFGPALELSWSYLSLTETSEYTQTPEEYREDLAAKGVAGEDLDRRVEQFADRMAEYNRHKLYPDMPEWEVACFYPMSHRREGEDNWYRLPFEERRALMHEHGRSGRAYTGRVLQLVTGSTGLDDWEWGVTLFAHDIADVKDIVYRLRFDVASARFAEFGPFVIGARREPDELLRDLGLES